jgi:proline iminopeptidase
MTTKTLAGDRAGIVDVDGAQLGYRIEGHGQPCLVVGSSVYYPRVFSQDLRAHLQLVFVDLRHFATRDPSFDPDRISIETYPDDIEHVRQILELDDVVVIGHSIHGTIALEYARRYREQVRGVVAVGAPPHRSAEDPSPSARFWEADASEERKEILARQLAELTPEVRAALSPGELWAREYVASGPKIWFDPAYDGSWLWEGVVLDGPVFARVAGELFTPFDLAQEPAEIAVPVLVAHGRYDYFVAYTLWDEHLHKLPRHTYVLFERSGHTPPLEEPERFNQTLLAWVHGLAQPRVVGVTTE